jgi:hypothetical protein
VAQSLSDQQFTEQCRSVVVVVAVVVVINVRKVLIPPNSAKS